MFISCNSCLLNSLFNMKHIWAPWRAVATVHSVVVERFQTGPKLWAWHCDAAPESQTGWDPAPSRTQQHITGYSQNDSSPRLTHSSGHKSRRLQLSAGTGGRQRPVYLSSQCSETLNSIQLVRWFSCLTMFGFSITERASFKVVRNITQLYFVVGWFDFN